MNFDVLTTAGLSQAQFGALVGVTRVTVNTWVKGHFKPRFDLAHNVARALDLIQSAVDAGELPVDATRREELVSARMAPIARALNKPGK